MPTPDSAVSIHPYFQVSEGKLDHFHELCERFVAKTTPEPKCLHYGFSFSGNDVYCRESYQDADGLLAHLANVDALLKEALTISVLARVEVHAPAEEIAKLKEPLTPLDATFFTLEYGFRH